MVGSRCTNRYHYQEFEGRGGAGRIKADGSESRMSPNSATDVGDSRLSERLALIVELRLCGIFTTPPRSSPAHFSGSYCLYHEVVSLSSSLVALHSFCVFVATL
jgi:hypothetical protein